MNENPVVVGYDGSETAEAALRLAREEAARLGAPLRIVHVLEWPTVVVAVAPGPSSAPDKETYRHAEELVATAVEAVRAADAAVAVTGEVRVGPPARELVAESSNARQVILGHRGRDGFPGLLLGSVGAAVSAHARCPVTVVRGRTPLLGSAEPVLVGYDGSGPASAAVGVAFEIAAARRVDVRVLRAWKPPLPQWGVVELGLDPEELATAERVAVTEALEPWREKYPRVPVTVDVVADRPARALVFASGRCQLLVVGSRGRGGFRGLILGSVSQQMLHHAQCPVVVVHESGPPA
jgi:nucleotide-binding universal stress UspA family protein